MGIDSLFSGGVSSALISLIILMKILISIF
jgi:hypothetical protein